MIILAILRAYTRCDTIADGTANLRSVQGEIIVKKGTRGVVRRRFLLPFFDAKTWSTEVQLPSGKLT